MEFLISTIFSLHLGVKDIENTIHPHIGMSNQYIAAGIYHNTNGNVSGYVGRNFKYKDFDILVGGVSGYKLPIDSPIAPMLIARYNIDKNFKVIVMPTIDKATKNPALVVGLEIVLFK